MDSVDNLSADQSEKISESKLHRIPYLRRQYVPHPEDLTEEDQIKKVV
jgi:hypothetical protein